MKDEALEDRIVRMLREVLVGDEGLLGKRDEAPAVLAPACAAEAASARRRPVAAGSCAP